MQKALASCCLGGLIAVSGCASIVSQSSYPVTINSTPPGATVVIKNRSGAEMHKAQTPTTITLDADSGFFSKAEYTMEFRKEGFEPATATLNATLNPWYIGNIVFGGLIGLLIVDPATGAMWSLDDNLMGGLTPIPGNQPPVVIPLAAPASSDSTPVAGSSAQAAAPVAAAPAIEPAAPPAPAKSAADKLRDLKSLKDDGVISNEEYMQKRAPLIDQL